MQRLEREMSASHFGGFTLIEVMITVAVIAILAAVALPSYLDYVTRGNLVEARSNLSDMRTRLEQYFLDNRAYPSSSGDCIPYAAGAAPAGKIYLPGNSKNFTVDCQTMSATGYTVRAQGLGFTFTIDQANNKVTVAVPSGWHTPSPNSCWVMRKSGEC
jgi:type IV pilus assembly protein PilE